MYSVGSGMGVVEPFAVGKLYEKVDVCGLILTQTHVSQIKPPQSEPIAGFHDRLQNRVLEQSNSSRNGERNIQIAHRELRSSVRLNDVGTGMGIAHVVPVNAVSVLPSLGLLRRERCADGCAGDIPLGNGHSS